jgi:hypothetical protein
LSYVVQGVDTKEENKLEFLAIPTLLEAHSALYRLYLPYRGEKKEELKVGHHGWLLIDRD